MLTLADVLEALTGTRPEAASLIISEAAIDSRLVIPGALFVALPGERVDGHDYVEEAFRRGAHLALVQKDLSARLNCVDVRNGKLPESLPEAPFCLWVEDTLKALQSIAGFWRRKLNIRVVGITGSVGKSTTKELIYEVLSQRYHTLKSPGNLNNEIGLPLTLLRLSSGYERAVLEMGFYVPGEISFLCDLALPQVGVITNVGTVHAERAGSQEAIARGKAELVQALPPAPNGVAILNYDDPWVRPMAAQTQAQTLFYGLDPEADLWADEIESQGLKGILFRLHYRQETLYLRAPMIGQHSVHTVLRATAVGLAEGLSWQEIVTGLQQGHTQLRLMAVHTESGALVLDDTYNASPESTMAALNLLNELSGRRIAVLGDMLELGPYEKQGHELVGIRAAQVARLLVAVGNRGKMIAEAARQAGMSSRQITWVETVPEAITVLQGLLKADDVVLVKGSHGLHMERIVSALETHA
ncbi:MAG TPA: UDP-N-acetylmuramoyl-tripeptide--D-alanyl-D-alanine ligase [Anaerolineaceae bacterium]|nr:UDP-N-acetylmuramoyl-tripeptide--D-alanyl-D-alanine ligase [Anaerolineaceae bacterium]HQH86246.1 UDP-N-acetylmuramoyl-tripeptide--D-alanyl-D-alanine ligase [Anaerolineaceae bacterium]